MPEGWIPCAHLYPPRPVRDGLGMSRAFQANSRSRFQDLLVRYDGEGAFTISIVGYPSVAGHPTVRFPNQTLANETLKPNANIHRQSNR
jgi:hypothetical protein